MQIYLPLKPMDSIFDSTYMEQMKSGWQAGVTWRVVLRRQIKDNLAVETNAGTQQGTLHFVDHSGKIKVWEYAVLVTHADYSLESLGQLYRDRADCENGFDELKNQWSWGVIPLMTWHIANSQHEQSHSSTIGGAGMFVWPTPKHTWTCLLSINILQQYRMFTGIKEQRWEA